MSTTDPLSSARDAVIGVARLIRDAVPSPLRESRYFWALDDALRCLDFALTASPSPSEAAPFTLEQEQFIRDEARRYCVTLDDRLAALESRLSDAGKEKPSLPLGPGSECPYCGRTVLEGDAGVHSPLKCFAYNEPSNLRERRIRRASRIETLEELLNVAVQHGYDDASVKSPLYARIRSLLSSARSEAG